ncbi:RiPP maturation radical SAM C-methyltransferase [Myxococcus sp. SDU36]|uniref:RiPP maturation radical SAM C-methyltransferase n=1 Tax=Myxococcus sp. SDU36 TaxID=2831967 RepID=UPI002543CE7A|nr:RiPP maturation radical SAM C-methyltransferase [Myxococcus sp. SDU36]WIG95368.1 RiPP maturation radical SAM C-methyltransferase [Myxococcus sp. SDU36]
MRILLVAMPWHSLDTPSLAVGILHECVKRCRSPHEVIDIYANLKWVDYLHARSQGQISIRSYLNISERGIWSGMGDWLFAPALHGTTAWKQEDYVAVLPGSDWNKEALFQVQGWTPDFIETLADELLALKPDLVGFTSTFMQNVPALSLAQALKRRAPEVLTAMGGANCDGPQGLALHRNFPCLDFVVRGEGEAAFVELLDAVDAGEPLDGIQGLCWRKDGQHVANPGRKESYPTALIPAPNYDAYFETLSASPLRSLIEPKLVMEGARGCWWGEKHHCTFCGLNGSSMAFRSKPPEQLWEEVRRTVARYQVLDIYMVDNIIDMKYFKALLPHIAASGLNLRLQYEVKSNLTQEQVQTLKSAGVVSVQPGIENLSSHVLKLMDKGVNGCHNIQTLRDCEEQGLTVTWNYLFGFPGEQDADYDVISGQMPSLVHLQPPSGANRILLERFSPNFENPKLGFAERDPATFYPLVYELPREELMDLAYLFNSPPRGIKNATARTLSKACSEWRDNYRQSELSFREEGGRIFIRERRVGRSPADLVLEAPHEVAVFHLLRKPQTPGSLAGALRPQGHERTPEQVSALLAEWLELGLVFQEDGRFIALPIRAAPQRVRLVGEQTSLPAVRPEGLPDAPPGAPDDVPELSLAALTATERVGTPRARVRVRPDEWSELTRLLETRRGGPALAVTLDADAPGAWPSSEEIDRLLQRGVVEVRVPWEMQLDERQPERSVHFIRFLRDSAAARLRVHWNGTASGTVKARALNHLEPPVSDGEDALRAWKELYAYGRCYWRAGPDFVLIKDARAGGDFSRFTLEEGPLRDVFTRLTVPQHLDTFGADETDREALDVLMEEDLVLRLGDWVVALPYQIKHWPVPFMSI